MGVVRSRARASCVGQNRAIRPAIIQSKRACVRGAGTGTSCCTKTRRSTTVQLRAGRVEQRAQDEWRVQADRAEQGRPGL